MTEGSYKRVVGLWGAVLLGLGSIVGTGVFVSLGLGAEVAGADVVIAVAVAALVACANGISSAQLARAHPVSGGTYAYGRRYLGEGWGFIAGATFLIAKSASAATAALGLVGYVAQAWGGATAPLLRGGGLVVVLVLTLVVAGGIRRTNWLNAILVATTLSALVGLVILGAPEGVLSLEQLAASPRAAPGALLSATALMFVAYTGYGRIATLGEEIRDPKRTIVPAILTTLAITALLYACVAAVSLGALGAPLLAEATRTSAAPLAEVARELGAPRLVVLLQIAAVTAMAGVLLNLLLGLSRVLQAMAKDGELPRVFAPIDAQGSPRRAVIGVGALIAALAAIGSVRVTWSLSALSVLVYYAITNLAALRLPAQERSFPRAVSAFGLVSCLGLAAFVDLRTVAATAGALAALGLGRFALGRRR